MHYHGRLHVSDHKFDKFPWQLDITSDLDLDGKPRMFYAWKTFDKAIKHSQLVVAAFNKNCELEWDDGTRFKPAGYKDKNFHYTGRYMPSDIKGF